jgi:hypothetical protein
VHIAAHPSGTKGAFLYHFDVRRVNEGRIQPLSSSLMRFVLRGDGVPLCYVTSIDLAGKAREFDRAGNSAVALIRLTAEPGGRVMTAQHAAKRSAGIASLKALQSPGDDIQTKVRARGTGEL